MKTATEEKCNWKTRDGKTLECIVSLEIEKEIDLDGYKTTVDCCDIYERYYLDGKFITTGTPMKVHKSQTKMIADGIIATVGPIGMVKDTYDLVTETINKVKNHPVWLGKVEKQERASKEAYEYEKRLRHSGLCPKCGTWCYGDCEAN